MLRQWECKILERVGMTKKTRISNVCNRGPFLLVTVMWIAYEFWKFRDWYHAVVYENADFLFRFPLSVKEMIALMVFLLLFSIIFPGIIYKKLKKKRK